MMRILVSAAALRTSGARTIYRQFIQHLASRVDGNQYFVMVDECMEKPEIDGVEYLVVDVSSKWKRIGFELLGFWRMLKKHQLHPDMIVSLQNLGIWQLKRLPQIIYYHQSLPFFDYKWHPLKKGEAMMFFYKHVYPHIVRMTLGKRVRMIAQLPFIKRSIEKCYKIASKDVNVLFPDMEKVDITKMPQYTFERGCKHFIFPATSAPYKGHSFLVQALAYLWKQDAEKARRIRVHFTLNKEKETRLVEEMYTLGVESNFVFHGIIPHEVLLSMYKSSDGLLFPSVIETLGLPLIECALFGKVIYACDLEYAHEVLHCYEGARFLSSRSVELWGDALVNDWDKAQNIVPMKTGSRSSWEEFFDIIQNPKTE